MPYFFFRPFPPGTLKQRGACLFVEAPAYVTCRVASHYGVRCYISSDHSTTGHHGAVTYTHPREDRAVRTQPYVAADHYIATGSTNPLDMGRFRQICGGMDNCLPSRFGVVRRERSAHYWRWSSNCRFVAYCLRSSRVPLACHSCPILSDRVGSAHENGSVNV